MGLFSRKDKDLTSELMREAAEQRAAHDEHKTVSHTRAHPGVADADVEQLVAQNQLIAAIKLYRERTGMGLKEAKEAVDAIRNDMRGRGVIR